MRKIFFEGAEFSFYEDNIFRDNMVLISFKGVKLKTIDVKKYLDTFISAVSDLVEAGAVVDERLEKYSTALSVLNAMKAVFSRKNLTGITVEMGKITIDVIKEIALLDITEYKARTAVKAGALAAKKLMDLIGGEV